MTITPSRMLSRLDADIAAAADPVAADCLRAERAAYLARQGHLAEAAEALEAIRRRHAARPNAAVSAWVSLAEGILIHFTDMDPRARDKVMRAYALSTASGLRSIQANSAAWMAHLEYARLDLNGLGQYARFALDMITPADRAAMSRICLTLGLAIHFASTREMAEPWYSRVRRIALADGDDAMLVALSHNMAWLLFSELRKAHLTKNEIRGAARAALIWSESESSLTALLGDKSLPDLSPILRAQLLSILGECRAAEELYVKHLVQEKPLALARFGANLNSDLAWCYARLGERERALEFAELAERSINPATQIDELAATYSQLRLIYDALDLPTKERLYAEYARKAWVDFQVVQDRAMWILGSIQLPPDSGLH